MIRANRKFSGEGELAYVLRYGRGAGLVWNSRSANAWEGFIAALSKRASVDVDAGFARKFSIQTIKEGQID